MLRALAARGLSSVRVAWGFWAGSRLPRGLARVPSNVSRLAGRYRWRRASRGVWNGGVQSKEPRRRISPSPPRRAPLLQDPLAAAWHAQERVSASARYRLSLHPHPSQTPAGDAVYGWPVSTGQQRTYASGGSPRLGALDRAAAGTAAQRQRHDGHGEACVRECDPDRAARRRDGRADRARHLVHGADDPRRAPLKLDRARPCAYVGRGWAHRQAIPIPGHGASEE